MDDRPEFANRQRFPNAHQVLSKGFDSCFDQLEFPSETYCVIVTRGHVHDALVLRKVLERKTRYVGMIGTAQTQPRFYDQMKQGDMPDHL